MPTFLTVLLYILAYLAVGVLSGMAAIYISHRFFIDEAQHLDLNDEESFVLSLFALYTAFWALALPLGIVALIGYGIYRLFYHCVRIALPSA